MFVPLFHVVSCFLIGANMGKPVMKTIEPTFLRENEAMWSPTRWKAR